MIVDVGRYCRGVQVDATQSTVIRSVGTLTPDAVAMIRAMFTRASEDRSDFLWIGLAAPTPAELIAAGEVFSIPSLWLDDALNPRQRAKADFGPTPDRALSCRATGWGP